MATIKLPTDKLPQAIEMAIRNRLNDIKLSSILVDRAKMRIRKGGDSTIKYPELWAVEEGIGYRKRGKPLRDTSTLFNMLSSKSEKTSGGVRWTLTDGSGYGIKHQEGFTNEGPIAIALSSKAKPIIRGMGDPPHDILELDSAGLQEAPDADAARNPRKGNLKYDYYVLEGNPKVPARPIANNPPEDIKAIARVIKREIKGIK